MGVSTRNIIDYMSNVIGTLTLPDTTTDPQWALALAPYAVNPATAVAQQTANNAAYLASITGPAGPAMSFTESTPTRTMNTAFQPSSLYATLVFYTVTILCTATLLGGQTGTVQLLSDTSPTPTTVRSSAVNTNSVSLAVAITAVNSQASVLTYVVPAGHYVKIASAGTATMSLTGQSEVTLVQG